MTALLFYYFLYTFAGLLFGLLLFRVIDFGVSLFTGLLHRL